MSFFKKKRVKNRALLDSYHNTRCLICGVSRGTVAHHIKTKKSGGPDVEVNLAALCIRHHREIHDVGIVTFSEKYPRFAMFLNINGWQFNGSWHHPDF